MQQPNGPLSVQLLALANAVSVQMPPVPVCSILNTAVLKHDYLNIKLHLMPCLRTLSNVLF